MTHFVGFVLVPKDKLPAPVQQVDEPWMDLQTVKKRTSGKNNKDTTDAIQNQLDELLEHWNENRQVEPYKDYDNLGEVTSMLFHYMKDDRKEEALLEKLKDVVPDEVFKEKRMQYIDGTPIIPNGGDFFKNIPDMDGMPEPIGKRVLRLLDYVEANPPAKPADFEENYEGHWGRKFRYDLVESSKSEIQELEKLETLQDFFKKKAKDWCGDEMYVEAETGKVYNWTRYNKDSKWDWWITGADSRWHDTFPEEYYDLDKPEDREKMLKGVFEVKDDAPIEWKKKWNDWGNTETLPEEYREYNYPSVLVCDGEWLSRKDWGWFGMSTETVTPDDWNKKVNEKLDAHPNHIAVAVDFHI